MKRRTKTARYGKPRREPYPNLLISFHVLSSLIGRAFYGELASRFGIGIAEWRVLLTLAGRREATSVDLAAEWAMEKMAVSRAVRWLENGGYLARRADAADKRRQVLRLTPAGKRLCDRILPVANARYREIVDCLGSEELAALRVSIDRLISRTAELAGR
jgi:DNA-binding MarR family transcriptional regulator